MRHLSIPLLLVLLLGVPLLAQAQVYQWKDASGTVHYSDAPPAHGVTYKSVKVDSNATHATDGARANASVDDQGTNPSADQSSSDEHADTPLNRQKLCTNLSSNIKTLKNPRPVIITGKDNKPRVMSSKHRSQELTEEQAQYKQFCSA